MVTVQELLKHTVLHNSDIMVSTQVSFIKSYSLQKQKTGVYRTSIHKALTLLYLQRIANESHVSAVCTKLLLPAKLFSLLHC